MPRSRDSARRSSRRRSYRSPINTTVTGPGQGTSRRLIKPRGQVTTWVTWHHQCRVCALRKKIEEELFEHISRYHVGGSKRTLLRKKFEEEMNEE